MIPLATNQLPQLIVYSRKGASLASGRLRRPAPAVSLVCCVALVFKVTEALVLITCMSVSGRGGAMHAEDTLGPARLLSVNFYIFLFAEDHHPNPTPRGAAQGASSGCCPDCI